MDDEAWRQRWINWYLKAQLVHSHVRELEVSGIGTSKPECSLQIIRLLAHTSCECDS